MPKISQYSSQETLTNQSPNVNRNIAQEGMTGQNVANLGGAVQQQSLQYIETFKKAEDFKQRTDAELEANQRILDLKSKVAQENDTEKAKQMVLGESQKILSETSSKIKSKDARLKFQADYGLHTQNAVYEMNQGIKKKIIDSGVANTNATVDSLKQSYYETNNATVQANIKSLISKKLNDAATSGFITKEEQQKETFKVEKDLLKGGIKQSIQYDAQATLENLQSGYYKGLSAEEHADLMKEAKVQIKANGEFKDNFIAQTQNKRESEIISDLSSGGFQDNKIQIDAISKEAENLNVSGSFFESLKKSSLNPTVVAGVQKTDPEAWQELVGRQSDKSYSRKALRNDVMAYYADGKISNEDLAKLTKNPIGVADQGEKKDSKGADFSNGLKFIQKWVSEHAEGDASKGYELTKDFMALGATGGGLELAKSLIQKTLMSDHPEVGNLKEIPNSVMDAKGGFKKIYDQQQKQKADYSLNKKNQPAQFTEDDLKYTAEKNGLTVEEVKKKLGI